MACWRHIKLSSFCLCKKDAIVSLLQMYFLELYFPYAATYPNLLLGQLFHTPKDFFVPHMKHTQLYTRDNKSYVGRIISQQM